VMFVLQNSDSTTPTLSNLTVEELEIDNGMADFDLSLSLSEKQNELVGIWKYNTDLFAPETIAFMAEHWQKVLVAIASDPDRRLADLQILSEAESEQLGHKRRNHAINSTTPSSQTEEQRNYVAPRTPTEQKLTKIWEQILGVKPIGIKDNFFELGGESLVALALFTKIEKVFGNNLPITTLLKASTVEELAIILSQTEQSIPSSCSSLVPIQPHGSKPPLFLVHGAGLHVMIFKDLATYLGSDRPLYGLQPKGLNSQETPLFTVEDMAAHYIKAMQTVQPQGPYYIGGFSFGGLVAFEMAQQLVRQGQEVGLVALLDTFSPNCFQKLSLSDKRLRHWNNSLKFGLKYAFKLLGKHIQRSWQRRLRKLTISYFTKRGKPLPYKLQEACVGGGVANAENNYAPQVYPGKLTLFRASEAPQEWSFNARNKPSLDDWYNRDPQYGWGELTVEGLDILDVPGDHNLMLKEPYIEVLATKLNSCLEESIASRPKVRRIVSPFEDKRRN
ncbi:MAG: thioesterase domain-containing protein, partial [Cyanobacteria bacterium P01_G01_bin.19]